MAVERTLCIIKPDAVEKHKIGAILAKLEESGFNIVALKKLHLTRPVAEGFYAVHKERGFFKDLVRFMTSGPVIVQVLQGEGAVAKNRELMGATDSKKAAPGTIRARFGTDIEKNAAHGSDAPETARQEIGFFFSGAELAALGVD